MKEREAKMELVLAELCTSLDHNETRSTTVIGNKHNHNVWSVKR